MEKFSELLAICAENSPVPGEFPAQRPVTRSFDVFFDLHPNKRLSKQSWGWWSETPSSSLWRHRNDIMILYRALQWQGRSINGLRTHNRHPISHHHGRALVCLLWVFWRKLIALKRHRTVYFFGYILGLQLAFIFLALLWRHNGRDRVSNHQPHDCLLNRSSADQRKHRSSTPLAFVRRINRWPVNSTHKWPVTWNFFHLMTSSWTITVWKDHMKFTHIFWFLSKFSARKMINPWLSAALG